MAGHFSFPWSAAVADLVDEQGQAIDYFHPHHPTDPFSTVYFPQQPPVDSVTSEPYQDVPHLVHELSTAGSSSTSDISDEGGMECQYFSSVGSSPSTLVLSPEVPHSYQCTAPLQPPAEADTKLSARQGKSSRKSSPDEPATSTDAHARRRAQNRAAQKAFRERRDQYQRGLKTKIEDLICTQSALQSENSRLKELLSRAQDVILVLRGDKDDGRRCSDGDASLVRSLQSHKAASADATAEGDSHRSRSVPSLAIESLPKDPGWDQVQAQMLRGFEAFCEQMKQRFPSDGTRPV